jgi:RNA polymerase sigma-70 factor, ECF subfamily
MNTSESDEALAARYLQGEAQAFRELAARYSIPIYNLARRLTRDPMEAENITQETLLRALDALPRVSLDQPLHPWFFKIAVNLCRQWAERKRPQLFSELDSADGMGVEAISDDRPSALEQLEEAELREQVRRQVERLPPLDQTVIVLRYVEALSYEQIAEALSMPLNTVRTRLRRAKLKLRAALEEEER